MFLLWIDRCLLLQESRYNFESTANQSKGGNRLNFSEVAQTAWNHACALNPLNAHGQYKVQAKTHSHHYFFSKNIGALLISNTQSGGVGAKVRRESSHMAGLHVKYQRKNCLDTQEHLFFHHVIMWLERKMLEGDHEEDYQGPRLNSLKIRTVTREGDF